MPKVSRLEVIQTGSRRRWTLVEQGVDPNALACLIGALERR
jgi:hypothetical protein